VNTLIVCEGYTLRNPGSELSDMIRTPWVQKITPVANRVARLDKHSPTLAHTPGHTLALLTREVKLARWGFALRANTITRTGSKSVAGL
jgi:hypothetical protein